MFAFIMLMVVAGAAFHFWFITAPVLALYVLARVLIRHDRRKG